MGTGIRKFVADQPYSMCPVLRGLCAEFYSPPEGGFVPIGWYVRRSA